MERINKIYAIALLVFASLLSCKKEGIKTYEVDAVFEPYVQLFIEEGAKRGHDIDFNDTGLLVEFSDKIVDDASGYCYLGQYHIVIDKTEWNMLAENEKVFLIFHELGHCDLDRRHRNDQFNNGVWKSMMKGDPLSGTQKYQPVAFYGFRKNYYLNELFNEEIPLPTWGNLSFGYDDVLPEEKELLFEINNQSKIVKQFDPVGNNFEIELEFSGINSVSYITDFSWGTASHYFYVHIFRNFGTFIGVYQNGIEQHLYYHPSYANIGGSAFNQITARQQNGTTQVFFNGQFVFHLDEFPLPINFLRCEAKNGDNTLANGFKIDAVRLNGLP